ncbi:MULTISPECIES: TraB/GumN family protein [Niastella]|uniref:TraB/GumN family protein n=1 Tax=Niastella soli TaxID=2821487 RepID=A0ABS3YXE3_9BACT|nr:TraB/GumN family protein [Niastella soli]MBO9201821.1 TraB/GumN family protein [Niastella soli]
MLFFYMALAITGIGQQNTDSGKKVNALAVKPVPNHLDNTLLWKISGNGLKRPSYLYGTMHVLCAEDATVSDSLKFVIRNCDQVYFELDMDNFAETMGALKYIRMNNGTKLQELLTPQEYARVEAYFKQNSLPLSMFSRFKPYFITSIIGEKMMDCSGKEGESSFLSQKNGMEELIMREAKQYSKEIKGLETTEFQASIFDSIPYEKQAKDLVNYIDSIDSFKKETVELVQAYRDQNLDRLDSLGNSSDGMEKEFLELLLYGRNRRWVEKMQDLMKENILLFAVGAGHLPGDQGVINLLRKKGYKLTPMKNIAKNKNMESM